MVGLPQEATAKEHGVERRGVEGTLCHTGLARVKAEAVSVVLRDVGIKQVKVHTIVVHEADPKIDMTVCEIEDLNKTGSLHDNPVIMFVHRGCRTAAVDDSDSGCEHSFSSRVDEMEQRMVRLVSPK